MWAVWSKRLSDPPDGLAVLAINVANTSQSISVSYDELVRAGAAAAGGAALVGTDVWSGAVAAHVSPEGMWQERQLSPHSSRFLVFAPSETNRPPPPLSSPQLAPPPPPRPNVQQQQQQQHGQPPQPLVPRWTPNWHMPTSTIVQPCNYSGLYDYDAFPALSRYGIVDYGLFRIMIVHALTHVRT